MEEGEGERTEAMNMPKRPPIPKPMTPDMTVLPAQEFITSWNFEMTVSNVLLMRSFERVSYGLDAWILTTHAGDG